MICKLDFPCYVGVELCTFRTLPGSFSFSKTSGPSKNPIESDTLL